MMTWRGSRKALYLGATLLCGNAYLVSGAQAAPDQHSSSYPVHLSRSGLLLPQAGLLQSVSLPIVAPNRGGGGHRVVHATYRGQLVARHSHGISCVPYAREVSGIRIPGNAWRWWHNAKGLYQRGGRPEVGSVLNFRANGRMPLGHVAVVERVVNSREILVQQANWPSFGVGGQIMHNVSVVDVSEANNWSAVRVELGRGNEFGSVYPTYGFIYNKPDTGVVTASVVRPAPQPDINPVPSDLRPKAERPWHTVEEVAQYAPSSPTRIEVRIMPASDPR